MGSSTADDLVMSDAEDCSMLLPGRRTDGIRLLRFPGKALIGRRLAWAASAALLLATVAWSMRVQRPAGPESTGTAAAILEEFELLGKSISPFEAVKQSFKKDILKIDGAFTGGECYMDGDATKCPLSAMPRDNLTGVFPGGETRCLLNNTPYIFQVIPGDSDKLLMYFQGGGACWDGKTASAMLCVRAVAYEGAVGIFDRENPSNPYRSYTIIIVGYCSGDAHVGHSDHDWSVISLSSDGVKQRGYVNARTAVDWAKRNLGGDKLDSLIITGSSAGALGTQVWADTLLKEFSWQNAAVIADSYAGIFPSFVQGKLIKNFGVCDTGLLPSHLWIQCKTETIDLQQVFEHAMRSNPSVAFASLDSKIDFVQIAFYKVVYGSMKGQLDHLGPKDFADKLMGVYNRYNLYMNWVSYSVNGVQHMYLNNPVMYQTTPVGNQIKSKTGITSKFLETFAGSTITGDDTPLVDWLAELPVHPGHKTESHCSGLKPKTELPSIPPPSTGFLGKLSAFAKRAKSSVSTAFRPAVQKVAKGLGFEFTCVPVTGSKSFFRIR